MSRWLVLVSILFASLSAVGEAADRPRDLTLRATYIAMPDPLTTEKIWLLDPDEVNPHRQRWLLTRHVDLKGLEAYPLADGQYGVRATTLEATSQGYVRPEGPWYRPMTEFRCDPEPREDFATEAGVRKAVASAAASWQDLLKIQKTPLELVLARVTGSTPESAIARGERVFRAWLREMDQKWRVAGMRDALISEWRHYLETASAQKVCSPSKRPAGGGTTPKAWAAMMEPPPYAPSVAEDPIRILARAPSRRWNGLFSVRMDVAIAGKTLNGRFLLDTGAGESTISPVWLEAQGMPVVLVEIPGAPPQRVSWILPHQNESGGLAKRGLVDQVIFAGMPASLTEMLLIETDLFGPPESVGGCCDGILGTDFLRKFVVEFYPGPPSEVRIWPREGFRAPSGYFWTEASIGPGGDIQSSCQTSKDGATISGARWDTGSEVGLDVHGPWQSVARAKGRAGWSLSCGDSSLGRGLEAGVPKAVGPLATKRPGVNVGIPVLAREPFFLDLPHGRIWLSDKLATAPVRENASGLDLQYELNQSNDRVLRVKSIGTKSPARSLIKAGLKAGIAITQIDDRPAADIDFWEVEQRLAGAYGDTVSLSWKVKDGVKVAPLKVR